MENNTIAEGTVRAFKWYESLQFKIATLFLGLFFVVAFSVFIILRSFGEKVIQDEAYLRLNQASSEVVAELQKHTVLSATLVDSMANLAGTLPKDNAIYQKMFPQIINFKGSNTFIAGGGVWPAPYTFDKAVERSSFFWAREASGDLRFYDNYNQKESKGYHHEEWYVPATYILKGKTYWSKSYTDPYSLEPMVTVSAPIIKEQQNIGVTTIDLKLAGLQQLLSSVTHSFSGYAFAVDRNGTFLSYPETEKVLSSINNAQGDELKSFINYQQFVKNTPKFLPIAKQLDAQRQQMLKQLQTKTRFGKKLSATLAHSSYQINSEEASLIAASIVHSHKGYNEVQDKNINVLLEGDALLNEPVFVAINIMQDTQWKIVTVMPYSKGVETMASAYQQLLTSTMIALVFTIFIIWLFIRYIITSPISHLAKQVQEQVDDDHHEMKLFDTSVKGELRTLVDIFNQRTKQLLQSQKRIEKLAHFDSLTGLPNRRMLINRLNNKLAGCEREDNFGALLFIDLDNFKRINDSLGHQVGDELLLHVAQRFTEALREEDTVARIGGDEFVVLITKNHTHSKQLNYESTVVAQKLVNAMQAPIQLNKHLHHMTISIGISVFCKKNQNPNEILRQADTAMYRAKAQGKNGFCFFSTEMQESAYRRIEIEEALRIALDKEQLFLMYQPQVDSHGNCIGAEALIRWTHPEKGVLSPMEFIPIAEESGLILELGSWVIETACAQLNAWSGKSQLKKISVNVSPKQFRDSNFIHIVRNALKKYQLAPKQLMLEITEGVVIENIKDTIDKMTILKSLGVRLSIDDFGTGYSSLKYLKELPLDQLKIDQSFVRDIIHQPKDAMIVTTIIAIANNLQLNVIAEGVEEREQVDMLIAKGCTQFQGYYFSKPKTAAQLNKLAATQPIKLPH